MALTKCNECGREISTSATACPGCGAPVQQARKSSGGGCLLAFVLLGGLAFVFIVIGVIGANSGSPSSSVTTAPRHPFEPAEEGGFALQLQIQRLINRAGERCDAVANVRGGGSVTNGDVFLLADCAGGDSHAVLVTPDNRIRYYMGCSSVFNPAC